MGSRAPFCAAAVDEYTPIIQHLTPSGLLPRLIFAVPTCCCCCGFTLPASIIGILRQSSYRKQDPARAMW